MAQVVKKQASYEDLSHLPDNVLGEIVDVELILTPRPSRKHVVATTVLGAEILPPYQFGRGGGPSGWMTLYEKGGHFMRSMNCLAVVAILFLVLAGNLFAFKAPDESRFPVKSVGVSESVPGLQDITVEDINRVVSGDIVQAAKEVLDDIMKTRFEQAASDQKGASGTGSALPPFTAEVRKVETDSLGFTHIRMAQLVQGLPVVGGEMIVHIDNRNVVYYINGKHLPPVAISIEPSISSETVLQAAIEEFAGVPEVEVGKQPSLVVYGSHLAYHFAILQKGGFAGQWWHYVDAHTGELLLRYNNIQFLMAPPTPGKGKHTKVSGNRLTGEGGSVVKMKGWKEKGGNFYLYNFKSLWGVYDEGLVDWEQQASSKWGTSDRAAISAGYNFGLTQAWVKKVLKRNSFDDQGAFARANIHTSDPSCPNAWWDGTDFHFCDRDGKKSADTPSTDIVAHEYGHAITKYTSNLTYYGESGALNESYSDIMAAAVEFAEQPDGRSSYPHHTAAKADWLIGEDAWLEPLRDMKMPKRFGQPSYYRGLNWYFGSDDQGGVHTNNGVQNFAFYLLAEGGEGSNDGGCRFEVKGIGIKRAAAVAMRANMVYLSPASTYLDARKAWVRAATDLQYDVSSVEAAWAAVGVGRYRDNGDGTVTDTCSNLNWQQSGDGKPRTWEEAKAYCAGIGWRLPRIDELETIVDYSRHSPTIDPVFESVYVDAPFWSSSTSAYVPGYAWYLYFYDGKPNFFSKTSLGYARCVRGGPFWPFDPSSHLTATDHTVLDTLTHLEWQRTDDGVARTMDEASSYCSGLELGGYDDWRLPAIQELETIIDRTTFEPAASRVFECRSGGYWSGSIMPSSPDYAWTVYFDHGYAYCNFKTIFYYVRCVRGGP